MLLVSDFLPEVTQQIHSLRASGVMSFHKACALGAEVSALRKSAGIPCNMPVATFWVMKLFYHNRRAAGPDEALFSVAWDLMQTDAPEVVPEKKAYPPRLLFSAIATFIVIFEKGTDKIVDSHINIW